VTRLYLVRHGQTDLNAAHRLQGQSDFPLNETGQAQATALADVLAPRIEKNPVVVTSPLQRAAMTADPLASALGVTAHRDARLMERSYGIWEGLLPDERRDAYPEESAVWEAGGDPDVEGYEDNAPVAARMVQAAEEWCDGAGDSDVVLVSHGSALRLFVSAVFEVPLEGRVFRGQSNGRWSVLERGGDVPWSLVRYNVAS